MGKTIIISNRLPVKIAKSHGKFTLKQSAGGLATGLSSILGSKQHIWLGWPGMEVSELNEQQQVTTELQKKSLLPVYLSQEEIKLFYEGFSNEVLWPIFHYMSTYARYENSYWNAYVQVNKKFCEAASQIIKDGDTVWVHDYQLLLLPSLLRQRFPNVAIGFFLHIPFPSFELFRLLPWRTELLEGMLGADLLGFHTYDDARHFITSVSRLIQLQVSSNVLLYDNRSIEVDSFPMGIDNERFEAMIDEPEVQQAVKELQENFKNTRIILSIDRLDYSKGILQRLQAFECFLRDHKEYKEQVSLYMIVVPSRDTVLQYKELRDEIDKLVGNINARYRTNNWNPIHYFYRSFPMQQLSALYQFADVCLVTPMRDGMNLVCKEYIASRKNNDGVLILSEMAGASKELIDAIIVNPNNVDQMSEAIYAALHMPKDEQERRMQPMKELVSKYNVKQWVKVFMERLQQVKQMQETLQTRYVNKRIQQEVKSKYNKAHKRLLLLDYDGTLVGFTNNINMAKPDKELYSILEELSKDDKNDIVIISGRQHTHLEQWFGNLKINLIGEHGVWYKKAKGEWEKIKGLTSGWKDEMRPLLESFTERTPGSFIEEKTYSLAWHYRKTEVELGEIRASELMNNLRYIISDYGLNLLPGNKVIEIKNVEVNKGKTASYYAHSKEYDFIFAIGDDITDEDMFKALKDEDAITIKVNGDLSAAKYYLNNYVEVRNFLKELPEKTGIIRMFERMKQFLPSPFVKR